ncbi:HAMP domain-containing sensor histidine kinase [Erythrobacter sp. HL-111]|uniref:sensor histidine kinase n=1 Tax=Erythrobacter sp. HL-111 TaxID=1798193 RepID=UPI0006D9D837|nr:HAMP domain-containing sensor histidine kinase [Erythrobacter sp. HL-111]KPP92908.1 MAG: Signal transduction histidine kinase [Erythrobacteraceae bacterium HL-111]SDT01267.1 signal transduction histidine kinase [Erythrobacter sp. HL-111]
MSEARRSIFTRIVAAAIALSLVLLALLWWFTHQTVAATIERAAAAEVDVDLAGLVDIHASGGQEELAARIADRIALTPSEGSAPHYLLADDAGRRIAGDLAQWPDLDPMVSESGVIAIGANSRGYARAVQLAPDLRLVVARTTDLKAPVLLGIAFSFAAGGAVFVALVALGGRFAALGLARRIERINLAFREPEEAARLLPARPEGGDEIDELTARSAAALARVGDLVEAYRDTSEQLAHEIRSPLAHLDNRLVQALAADPAPAVAARLLEARAEIRRVVRTLESLLDIAASKARRGDRAGLGPVDLSRMVTAICELYAGSAEEAGLELDWRLAPGVVIEGDERQLSRLVTNMLDNAIKYVPAGGRVEVTLEPGPVLVVADDGPGIDPGDGERVFERFYRGRAGAGEAPGSGLGLALARAIAERHDLALTLEPPREGGPQGAVFRIGVPK